MTTLTIEREFSMPVDALFKKWTDATSLATWMCPNPGRVIRCDVDLRVGGRYSIEMETPSGRHQVSGQYQTIIANEQLVFTWGWLGKTWSNQVDVRFAASATGGSRLTLTQQEFPTLQALEEHRDGWAMCLAQL